jgi:hypothetical protein
MKNLFAGMVVAAKFTNAMTVPDFCICSQTTEDEVLARFFEVAKLSMLHARRFKLLNECKLSPSTAVQVKGVFAKYKINEHVIDYWQREVLAVANWLKTDLGMIVDQSLLAAQIEAEEEVPEWEFSL